MHPIKQSLPTSSHLLTFRISVIEGSRDDTVPLEPSEHCQVPVSIGTGVNSSLASMREFLLANEGAPAIMQRRLVPLFLMLFVLPAALKASTVTPLREGWK